MAGLYASLPETKAFCRVSGTAEDNSINYLIKLCSGEISNYCGRDFGSNQLTEYYVGTGNDLLVLNQRPVASVASVYVDETGYWGQAPSSFGSSTLLTAGVDYALRVDGADGFSHSGILFRIGGVWPAPVYYTPDIISPILSADVGNLKVTYTAGYTTVPSPVTLATMTLVSKLRRLGKYGVTIKSEKYEDYEISFAVDLKNHILGPEVQSLLSRHREIAVG